MKTSPRSGTLPPDLETRLADYERQAAAYAASRGPKAADVAGFAPAAPVSPDLGAPGIVSFTGGPSRESVKAGAPRDVTPAHAALYAELDAGVLTDIPPHRDG